LEARENRSSEGQSFGSLSGSIRFLFCGRLIVLSMAALLIPVKLAEKVSRAEVHKGKGAFIL
jgi:hypothetical protein